MLYRERVRVCGKIIEYTFVVEKLKFLDNYEVMELLLLLSVVVVLKK